MLLANTLINYKKRCAKESNFRLTPKIQKQFLDSILQDRVAEEIDVYFTRVNHNNEPTDFYQILNPVEEVITLYVNNKKFSEQITPSQRDLMYVVFSTLSRHRTKKITSEIKNLKNLSFLFKKITNDEFVDAFDEIYEKMQSRKHRHQPINSIVEEKNTNNLYPNVIPSIVKEKTR